MLKIQFECKISSVNSFLHFRVHDIRLDSKAKCTIGKSITFWPRNDMGILHLVFIHMRFLLLKSMEYIRTGMHTCIPRLQASRNRWINSKERESTYWLPFMSVLLFSTLSLSLCFSLLITGGLDARTEAFWQAFSLLLHKGSINWHYMSGSTYEYLMCRSQRLRIATDVHDIGLIKCIDVEGHEAFHN